MFYMRGKKKYTKHTFELENDSPDKIKNFFFNVNIRMLNYFHRYTINGNEC